MSETETSQHLNGTCMLHGRFDCEDCFPDLFDPEWSEEATTFEYPEGRA